VILEVHIQIDNTNFAIYRSIHHIAIGSSLTTSMVEKRRSPRVSCKVPVDIHAPSADCLLVTYATNLSATGVFVRVSQPLPIGSKLCIRLKPYGSLGEFEVQGAVVRHALGLDGHPRGMGVIFQMSDVQGRTEAEKLLRQLSDPAQPNSWTNPKVRPSSSQI
jgi:hypothetical protein